MAVVQVERRLEKTWRRAVGRVEDRKVDGQFPGLGRETRGRIPAGIGVESPMRSKDRWRDREACVEAKQSREVAGSIRCFEKNLDVIAPAWACILIIAVGVF